MTILREAVVRLPDGRNLGYAEHGVHDGIPVLYFHGTPGGRFYDLDGDAQGQHGIRLLSLERPSVGLSDPKPRRALLDWPRDVAAFADALGVGRFGVIGTVCPGEGHYLSRRHHPELCAVLAAAP